MVVALAGLAAASVAPSWGEGGAVVAVSTPKACRSAGARYRPHPKQNKSIVDVIDDEKEKTKGELSDFRNFESNANT